MNVVIARPGSRFHEGKIDPIYALGTIAVALWLTALVQRWRGRW